MLQHAFTNYSNYLVVAVLLKNMHNYFCFATFAFSTAAARP